MMKRDLDIGNDISDNQLLHFLAKRREVALKQLYNRYWSILYLRAKKVLQDEKSSEDVVQEVFIDLWEKESYDHIKNFKAYIYQAVKYKTLMALRKNRITDHHLNVFKSMMPDQSINQELRAGELREELIHHIDQLPPRCREVFYKSRFEHIDNQEIADELGISKRTVETHISHALRYLRGVKELLMIIIWLGNNF